MSLSVYKVTEPRLDFNEDPIYIVPESAKQILYRQLVSTAYSDNNIQFQQTLDRKYAIDTKMYVICEFIVTINGTPPPGSRLVNSPNDAPRWMPLTSVTQTLELSLNNQTFSQRINWYHDALMRYNNTLAEGTMDLSTFPSMPDFYQNYDDYLLYGSALNSLGNQGEAGQGAYSGRGGFPYVIVSGNQIDGTQAKIRFRTREPIIVSPNNWGHSNSKAYINVETVNVNYTLDPNLGRVWSRAAASGGIITSVTASISETGVNPILELILLSPKKQQMLRNIQRYPYSELNPYIVAGPTLAPQQTATVAYTNITLSGIPNRAYIFARRRNADRTYGTSDTYARIDRIDATLGTVNGIFTQASSEQLYTISRQNGLQMSWPEWSKYTGGVFCASFEKDIPIEEMQASGLQESIQFQFNIDFTNIQPLGGESISYSVYLVIVYDGMVSIFDGQVNKERNILTHAMINKSETIQSLPYNTLDTFAVSGGSFGSRLKKAATSAVNVAKKGAKLYNSLPPGVRELVQSAGEAGLDLISPRIMEVARDLGPAAKDIITGLAGKGYTENQLYNELVKLRGMGGGKKLTKAQLKRLAM